jgi:tetratricopeptide (TPR) repeat protein
VVSDGFAEVRSEKRRVKSSVGWQGRASALSLILAASVGLSAQAPSATRITFPTSGSPAAQEEFVRGVAALHSFEYEEANAAFQRAQKADQGFAMAYWGEAMTYHQSLWRNEDVAAGRRVLARLGPTPAARAGKAGTEKDRAYLASLEILFGPGDEPARRQAYADAMARLHGSDASDPEVASFYALALLGTMGRDLAGGADTHEGHSASLAGSDVQTRVAGILEAVLRSHPEHPGALHYLLHAYDDPAHARLGLEAARVYARVAPESSHARHMPAHIFLQLGLWEDAARSDRDAFAASKSWAEAKQLPPAMRNFHALSWLQYELLQLGRYREAWETIDEIAPVVKESSPTPLVSDLSSMRAIYVIETRRWDLMANERNFGNVNELCAIGFSAARRGNAPLAELARQALATRATSPQEGNLRPAIAIMEREVAAMIALAAGRQAEAVEILTAAASDELKLPAPLGLPAPIKPAPELLGEVLLEVGRPSDAIAAFQQALERHANRSLSVLGMARASAAIGQADRARDAYATLLANYERADADLPEIAEARAAREGTSTVAVSQGVSIGAAAMAIAIAAVVGLGVVVLRARRRAPLSLKKKEKREKGKARKGR